MSGWTLTNYWLLIVWIAVAAIIFGWTKNSRRERVLGKVEYRYPITISLIVILPYIIWAGNRQNGFGDTGVYRKTFLDAAAGWRAAVNILNGPGKDKGFYVLECLLKAVIGNQDVVFFLIIAIIQLLCITLVYRKYSEDYMLSIFLFVASTDYLSWTFNGVRQFIAASIIFACIGLMIKRKLVPLLIILLLVSTIHGSALLMIPIVLVCMGRAWNLRTVMFLVIVALAVVFLDRFTPVLDSIISVTQYEGMTESAIWINDDGTNPIRVLVYSVPAIMSLAGYKYIREAGDPVADLCVNMSVASAGFYVLSMVTSGIYIGRLPIYMSLFSYITLPWMIHHMFNEASGRIVKLCTIVGYMLFFYYQMHITWKLI